MKLLPLTLLILSVDSLPYIEHIQAIRKRLFFFFTLAGATDLDYYI